jgi:hypothetical protein
MASTLNSSLNNQIHEFRANHERLRETVNEVLQDKADEQGAIQTVKLAPRHIFSTLNVLDLSTGGTKALDMTLEEYDLQMDAMEERLTRLLRDRLTACQNAETQTITTMRSDISELRAMPNSTAERTKHRATPSPTLPPHKTPHIQQPTVNKDSQSVNLLDTSSIDQDKDPQEPVQPKHQEDQNTIPDLPKELDELKIILAEIKTWQKQTTSQLTKTTSDATMARQALDGTDIVELYHNIHTTTALADKATNDFADKDDSLRIICWIDILIERDKIYLGLLTTVLLLYGTGTTVLCTVPVHLLVLHAHFTLSPLFSFSTFYVYLRLAHRVQ